MKQIIISNEIKRMSEEYADTLFKDKTARFVQPIDGLKNLILDLQEVNGTLPARDKYVKYVEEIIKDFSKLKNLLPSEYDKYKRKYDEILKDTLLSVSIKYRKRDLPKNKRERRQLKVSSILFNEEIVNRMHYKDVRPYMGKYMKQIGMNTCVYCNNSKATYSERLKEVYYPFDHNKPKDKYPFLCICFFNLYPCCNTCNGHKLNDENKAFQIYIEEGLRKDPFVFEIERNRVIDGNPQSIIVDFKPRDSADMAWKTEYDNCYRINELYNSEDEKRNCYKMLKDIDKYRASYPDATEASLSMKVDRKYLFQEILGVDEDESNIFTDVNKKLKLDTAIDAKLI